MNDTMNIWNHASETDTSATKADTTNGYKSTSINGYWMFKKATELWGPMGTGWGVDTINEEYKDGAPILSDGNLLCNSVMHVLKIRLWYDGDPSMKGVEAYGNTPYIYQTKNGPKTDMEAPKKSTTDAIKKALSMLGFCSDVYQGQFDDSSYVQSQQMKEFIEKADQKDLAVSDARKELSDYVVRHLETIKGCQSKHELSSVTSLCVRHLTRQQSIEHVKDIAIKGVKEITRLSESIKKKLSNKDAA